MGEFLNVNDAKNQGFIPNIDNVIGFLGLGVYVSEYGSTALCSFVGDGNFGVLNIYQIYEGVKITCGHILSDGTCGYRFGKDGEAIKCPLLELNSNIVENPNMEKQAA